MRHFRTILSVFLAVLVLAASSSFYVGIHLCRGKVKAITLLNEADGCGHQSLPPCHHRAMDQCCDNEQIEHEASVLQLAQSAVTISPAFYFITQITVADFFQLPQIRSAVRTPVMFGHPPTSTGRYILSFIHILRI